METSLLDQEGENESALRRCNRSRERLKTEESFGPWGDSFIIHVWVESAKFQRQSWTSVANAGGLHLESNWPHLLNGRLPEMLHLFKSFSTWIISVNRPLSPIHKFSTAHEEFPNFSKISHERQEGHV